jgi:hypothetical protein
MAVMGQPDAAGGIIAASHNFDQTAARAALLSHNSYDYLKAHDQAFDGRGNGHQPCRSGFGYCARLMFLPRAQCRPG